MDSLQSYAAEHMAGRYLEVRYEDLTADTAGQLARITTFLGLPPLAAHDPQAEFATHGVRSAIRDMNADSFARLSKGDVDDIEGVAGPVLERYGYARP